METKNLACTNCGASLDYPGAGATVRCPYCGTSVIVPAEIRGAAGAQPPSAGASGSRLAVVSAGVVAIALLVGFILVRSLSRTPAPTPTTIAAVPVKSAPTSPRPPTAVPTAGLAHKTMTIGSAGTGPGRFNRSTNITVDGAGAIYVGDREGGRIQVFDPTGKFVAQWNVGSSKSILSSLAADRQGRVYAVVDGRIEIHDAASGKLADTLKYSGGDDFDTIALAPDGRLAAMWYLEHPGTLDPTEGVQGDLVQFDPQGQVTRVISDVVSSLTDGPERDLKWAVDGTGNLFALSHYSFAVFKFTPEGKYVSRFGSRGDAPDQFNLGLGPVAVDNQSRVFVADVNRVLVFDPDGRYLAAIGLDGSVYGMAIDDKNGIWLAQGDRVTKYDLQ